MNKNDKLFEYAQLLEEYEEAVRNLFECQDSVRVAKRQIEEAHRALFKFVEDNQT